MKQEELARILSGAASQHLGETAVIEGLRPLSGGASSEMWSFVALCGDTRHELILRLSPPGGKKDGYRLDRLTEAQVLRAAEQGGVPVPSIRFILNDDDEIGPGYAMQCVPGETIARKILRDDEYARARDIMARQCGTILAGIHAVDTGLLPPLKKQTTEAAVKELYTFLDIFGEKHPVFEFTLRWLQDHLPNQGELRLVHGDFRNGNFIVGPDGIQAVLDWELAHLGDPMEDLGWICVNSWRFGNIDLPVGGFGTREDLFSGYEEAGGVPVDPEAVHFWEVYGTLKWGIACIMQGFTHLLGMKRSVELAAIGRRTSETEIDLLRLLKERE
ncbi:MAG: phosphotransferase family protein [Deltaproteobacteria bacterium]|nr:phosphotransferase family protein [Deltaproteobacteria bacterium]